MAPSFLHNRVSRAEAAPVRLKVSVFPFRSATIIPVLNAGFHFCLGWQPNGM